MSDFESYCTRLLEQASAAGWRAVTHKSIPYGRQYEMSDSAGRKAMLNAYHGKKGFKHVAGGRDGAQLDADLGGAPPAAVQSGPQGDPFGLGTPRIGGDESGKGDYFGPLVVAAFHLDAATAEQLRDAGIADSKRLSDSAILKLAGVLDKTGRGEVLRLMPSDYNPAWRKSRNLNVLLAGLHGRCVSALIKRVGPPGCVVIDQFARDSRHLSAALPANTRLVTETRGERDLAVAAASILARAAFVEGLRELEHEYGMSFPPGAGPPVLKAARAFVRACGADELARVAKLHFKTTEQL
jgi:ribonuclease HIII